MNLKCEEDYASFERPILKRKKHIRFHPFTQGEIAKMVKQVEEEDTLRISPLDDWANSLFFPGPLGAWEKPLLSWESFLPAFGGGEGLNSSNNCVNSWYE